MCIVIFFFSFSSFSDQYSRYTFIKCTGKMLRESNTSTEHGSISPNWFSSSSSGDLHWVNEDPRITGRVRSGSHRIRVWDSVSMDGGPLVRRDGFTNTPWPGGQRKYTLPCTVPLCLPTAMSSFTPIQMPFANSTPPT